MSAGRDVTYLRGVAIYLALVAGLLAAVTLGAVLFGCRLCVEVFSSGIGIVAFPLVTWLLLSDVRGRYIPLVLATLLSSTVASWVLFEEFGLLMFFGFVMVIAVSHVVLALLAGWGLMRLLGRSKPSIGTASSTRTALWLSIALAAVLVVLGGTVSLLVSLQPGIPPADRGYFDDERNRLEQAVAYVMASEEWNSRSPISAVLLPGELKDLSYGGHVRIVKHGVPRLEFVRHSEALKTRSVLVYYPEKYLETKVFEEWYVSIEVLDNHWLLAKWR